MSLGLHRRLVWMGFLLCGHRSGVVLWRRVARRAARIIVAVPLWGEALCTPSMRGAASLFSQQWVQFAVGDLTTSYYQRRRVVRAAWVWPHKACWASCEPRRPGRSDSHRACFGLATSALCPKPRSWRKWGTCGFGCFLSHAPWLFLGHTCLTCCPCPKFSAFVTRVVVLRRAQVNLISLLTLSSRRCRALPTCK